MPTKYGNLYFPTLKVAPAAVIPELESEDPVGVGIYIRDLNKKIHGTPAQAAKKAADHGIKFVPILACWQDRLNGKDRHVEYNKDNLVAYAEAFAAKNIRPLIWGFPRAGWEEQFVETMKLASDSTPAIRGWLLDPEVYYKWKTTAKPKQKEANPGYFADGSKTARVKAAEKLSRLVLDALTERHSLGITSYGMADFHKNFPWDTFGGTGWGSPQLYEVGPDLIDKGIQQWRDHGWQHIVPSVPTFGPQSGSHLHDYLSCFIDGEEYIEGFVAWSWMQTNSEEWRVLARWANWFERGIWS